MRKRREILRQFEEIEWCKSCNQPMMPAMSQIAMVTNLNEQQQGMAIWICPHCQKSFPMTPDNQPMEFADYGDWEDISEDDIVSLDGSVEGDSFIING